MIHVDTVGMVKYPTMAISMKMMYAEPLMSGTKEGSPSEAMSFSIISTWMRASTELNRSDMGSHR